jgi:hypothetical protein
MEILIPIVLVVLTVVLLYYVLGTHLTANVDIVDGLQDGKQGSVTKQRLQPSTDIPKGLEFSYTGWLRIDDFTYRYGAQKIIFVKGTTDLSVSCPALMIDANTNTLLVKMDTFGAPETISVVSVPSKKWLHVAITVNQESLKVYINGILYANHTLMQLPRQNSGSVLVAPDGGFAGKMVSIEYQPRELSVSEIQSMSSSKPPIGNEPGALPPYFDLSWFAASDA